MRFLKKLSSKLISFLQLRGKIYHIDNQTNINSDLYKFNMR